MLKILMAGWYPEDENNIAGGPIQNTFIQVNTLKELDNVRVNVVSRLKNCIGNKQILKNGIDIHYVCQSEKNIIPNTFGMIGKIADVMKKIDCDVVISHNFTETLAAKKVNLKVVHIVHGISGHELVHAKGKEILRYWLQIFFDNKAIRNADRVVCISKYGADICRKMTKAPIDIISYPIVEDHFFEVPEYTNGKDILYAGTMNPMKNSEAAIKAMPIILEKHPDAKLNICGKLEDSFYLDKLKNYVQEHNIEDSVRFLGVITRKDIAKILGESVCLVLPSRQENTPNVIAQAMAASRAVVASNVGAVSEMLEDGVEGYIIDSPDNYKMLAEKVIELLDDKEKARQMGINARLKAIEKFERHAQIEQLLSICNKVLDKA